MLYQNLHTSVMVNFGTSHAKYPDTHTQVSWRSKVISGWHSLFWSTFVFLSSWLHHGWTPFVSSNTKHIYKGIFLLFVLSLLTYTHTHTLTHMYTPTIKSQNILTSRQLRFTSSAYKLPLFSQWTGSWVGFREIKSGCRQVSDPYWKEPEFFCKSIFL